MAASEQQSRKLYSLDYARGVAVLLVSTGHFFDLHPSAYESVNIIRRSISFSGLPLFFVLSGFLLTRQMVFYREKYAGTGRAGLWKMFFMNRLLRIYPAYLVSLLVLGMLNAHSPFDILTHAFNIHNFFVDHIMSINPVYWTLAVEFQWYLAFPFLFIMFSAKRSLFRDMMLLLFLFSLGFLWRQYMISQFLHGLISYDELFLFGHGQLIAHAFAFCLGIALFYFFMHTENRAHRSDGIALSAGIVLCLIGGSITLWGLESPSTMYGVHLNLGSFFFLPLGSCLMLYYMVMNEPRFTGGKKYFTSFVKWIGIISYSLYLWHYPVILKLHGTSQNVVLDFMVAFSAAIGLSAVSYLVIEKYFIQFKRVFMRRLLAKD
ncbi:MAG: acyltransferase [Nitrospirota bacterium]